MFTYILLSYDPIYEETDCENCFKDRYEALKTLRIYRAACPEYTFWLEVKCLTKETRFQLAKIEKRCTERQQEKSTLIDDEDLPF